MSSVHQQNGKPNWFCAFYDPEGFRKFRTTGTQNRRVAQTICLTLERAAKLAKDGKLSNEKALKIIRETSAAIAETHGQIAADRAAAILKPSFEDFIRATGGELVSFTIRGWLDAWLSGRTDASKATLVEYRRILDLFLKQLGARADRPLTTLQAAQVEKFKEHITGRVGPSTVNKSIKVLKAAFSNAVAKRHLEFSPAEHVEAVETEDSSRRPFTPGEIRRLTAKATGEWRTMILIGFYTGLRLRDCAGLTWAHVDLLAGQISISTQKTGRRVIVPMAEPLAKHLATLAGDKPDAPLCPSLAGMPAAKLSAEFYKVMVAAGVAPKRSHEAAGKGRDGKRERSEISFHSLRHNNTSALKSAGVSDAVAMDLVGHETVSISRNYTKIADATKREAVNKLPDITI
jgi:integrase